VFLKLIEFDENGKLHQITPICILTLFAIFQMIYFLYPERFPFLIFGLKEKEVEPNEALSVLIYFL